jgi:hypothetical protein
MKEKATPTTEEAIAQIFAQIFDLMCEFPAMSSKKTSKR